MEAAHEVPVVLPARWAIALNTEPIWLDNRSASTSLMISVKYASRSSLALVLKVPCSLFLSGALFWFLVMAFCSMIANVSTDKHGYISCVSFMFLFCSSLSVFNVFLSVYLVWYNLHNKIKINNTKVSSYRSQRERNSTRRGRTPACTTSSIGGFRSRDKMRRQLCVAANCKSLSELWIPLMISGKLRIGTCCSIISSTNNISKQMFKKNFLPHWRLVNRTWRWMHR